MPKTKQGEEQEDNGVEVPVEDAADVARGLREGMVAIWAGRQEAEPLPGEPAVLFVRTLAVGTDESAVFSREGLETLNEVGMTRPDATVQWIAPLLQLGPEAILAAAAELVEANDPAELDRNTLSWLGARVSYHLRRAVLRRELVDAKWNLTAVSQRFGLGGAGNVVRLINELGLKDEQKAAQKQGLGRIGGKRPRKAE